MLQTERQFFEAAIGMGCPLVFADTSKGSGRAKFILWDDCFAGMHSGEHELPRSLFNGLRDSGVLYEDPDNPLKVGDHRAWRVSFAEDEESENAEGEEV